MSEVEVKNNSSQTQETPVIAVVPLPPVSETLLALYIDQTVVMLEQLISKETPVNALSILTICVQTMQFIEQFKTLKGGQKKEVVISALTRFMKSRGDDLSLLAILPSFVDQAIGIEKGVVQISVSVEDVTTCCGSLLSLLGKKH